MFTSVLRANQRVLSRGAAVFLLAGMAAGCSSQAVRFNSVDDVFTGATANQRSIINNEQQPYPGDVAAAPVEPVKTEGVARGALEPVTAQPLPPVPQAVASIPEPEPALAPVTGEPEQTLQQRADKAAAKPAPALAPVVDTASTGSIATQTDTAMAEDADPEGWSRAGGTQVTVKPGETVYNLSRRFGVPAKVIMRVNGISEGTGLQAGQKVVIPTYVYSSKAPVSSPDSDPKVADAKSSTGNRSDQKAPLPEPASGDKVAVLPQTKKSKEEEAAKPSDAADASADKAKEKEVAKAEQPKGEGGIYTVESGDTLSGIARKTGVGVPALKQANGLSDGLLKIGQKLKVPAGGKATPAVAAAPALDATSTGSTGPKAKDEKVAAYTPPVTKKAEKLIDEAAASGEKAPDATGIGRMRWPVRGRVISGYGKASDGIDIAVPEGTAVKAAENGVVIYAGDGLKDFGNTVLIRHEDGLVTVYGNASQLKVQRGQKVKRGDDIALSGMTGNAKSPKLRFEVRKNSAPVDPSQYLE